MKKQPLNGKWQVSFTLPDSNERVETDVTVPCNIEPYLVSLGLLDDYCPADTLFATERFERVDDWTYTTAFDAEAAEKGETQELVFEGIDTIAQIYLNGEKLLDCSNMHLTYRADVTDKLYRTGNKLKVVIRSSELWAREHLHDMMAACCGAVTSYDSQSHIRKARHQWGWDNAPRLITSGIVRSVYLETLPKKRFEDVYLYTDKIGAEYVTVGANWIYQTDRTSLADHFIRFTLMDGERTVFSQTRRAMFVQGSFKCTLARELVELWWPSGFGEPKLYTVKLEMLEGEEIAACYTAPFGIRTLFLDWTEEYTEEEGGEFVFRVNGERVFIRGTNWKPLDPLVSVADQKLKTGRALDEIRALGCNMVRVWGGGVYEDPFFFDYCDRHGIMIWQDFMFACEIPPIDDGYCSIVEEEARFVIRKYRNHPALAVWCGDNEDDECMAWVNGKTTALPSYNRITREVLKRATACYDPYRSYVPSSPVASDRNFVERNREMKHFQTETHFYPDVVKQPQMLRTCKSLFLGETGPIETNAMAVNPKTLLREAARAERLWNETVELPPPSKETAYHQCDRYFKTWRQAGKRACLAVYGRDFAFEELGEYTLAINAICADVFKDIIEYCRVSRESKTGVIWWSLMDMFPMMFNYSVIDHEYNRKLPYYWIRESQQELALMAVRRELDSAPVLYAVNDTLTDRTVRYSVTAYDEAGRGEVIATGLCRQARNSASPIQQMMDPDRPQLWVIKWTSDGVTGYNHFITGRCSFETTRNWVGLIGREEGFLDEILELGQLDGGL